MTRLTAYLDDEDLARLRALRLWHWQKFLHFREHEIKFKVEFPISSNDCKILADFHIKQVQLLNDFFPVDDTAEKDNETS